MSSAPRGGGPSQAGAPPEAPHHPPTPQDEQRDKLRAARRRADRVYGIGLLVFGVIATILNMTIFTENALAMQFAAMSEQYGLDGYTRPDGLGALSLAGIIGHPVIYAIALYLTLIVWRRGRLAAWIPLVGAVVAFAFSAALMGIGITMHPELLQAASSGMPTATPTP